MPEGDDRAVAAELFAVCRASTGKDCLRSSGLAKVRGISAEAGCVAVWDAGDDVSGFVDATGAGGTGERSSGGGREEGRAARGDPGRSTECRLFDERCPTRTVPAAMNTTIAAPNPILVRLRGPRGKRFGTVMPPAETSVVSTLGGSRTRLSGPSIAPVVLPGSERRVVFNEVAVVREAKTASAFWSSRTER
jgi:hypothetical protein